MWEALRAITGEITLDEVALCAVIFTLVVLYAQAPRIGQAVGRAFERRRDD